MALCNLIQNVNEDKKDPFEKVESSRKLVKKKRTQRTVICEDKFNEKSIRGAT
jgi:tRNA 2-selenouridine synthase SelU